MGMIIHDGDTDTESEEPNGDEEFKLPIRIQEQNAEGTVVNALADQLGMLDYWANASIPFQIGV
jgi:hypothetical protein